MPVLLLHPPIVPLSEDSIFNTSCRIGRQTRSFCRVKAGNALDESDGPDGDQIVLIDALGIVFLYDVRDQTQIVFDQCVPGFRVALSQTIQTFPLLRGGQWPRKRAAPFQTQRKKKRMQNLKKFVMSFGSLPFIRQITRNCETLRNERNAKRKSTVVNDRAQFSVGTMRSHR